jgi:hypothetical protein
MIYQILSLGHKIEKGDCLSKTQDYAKSKDDVYDLTPVRCCNIER